MRGRDLNPRPPTRIGPGIDLHIRGLMAGIILNRRLYWDEMKFQSGGFHAPGYDIGNTPERSIYHTEHTKFTSLYLFRKNYIPYQKPAWLSSSCNYFY